MSNPVEREIDAYRAIQARVSGSMVQEWGFSIFCAPGVMPPTNRVTRCLGALIRRLTATSVLDLGCGTGILSLIASRFSREVVGVDIDSCAIACAQYNAALNGIENVNFFLGDGYLPVGQQTFDLIVSNPPFYPAKGIVQPPAPICINTDKALLYSLIKGLHQHLNPGGNALFVTSSLSDNNHVKELLQESKLDFSCQLLHQGQGNSQDIYIWKVGLPS